jgi:hypothetical protein
MSIDPASAPYRPAYVRDTDGNYYRIGGGGGGGGEGAGLTADAVTNAYLANMPPNTLKGNDTGSVADPEDLSASRAKTLLALTKSDVGLGAVDNTADTDKPLSTPQKAYVDARTPVIVKSTTAPTDLTAIWIDIN